MNQFFKNSVGGKKIKKAIVEKWVFTFICPTEFSVGHILMIIPNNM